MRIEINITISQIKALDTALDYAFADYEKMGLDEHPPVSGIERGTALHAIAYVQRELRRQGRTR